MKASELVTYLQNEIRKHGDKEVNLSVIRNGDNTWYRHISQFEVMSGTEYIYLTEKGQY